VLEVEMKKRNLSILISIIVLIGALGLTAILAGMKKSPDRKNTIQPVKLVITKTVENHNIQAQVPVMGRLTATHKIDIFAEVSGVLLQSKIPFLEGVAFKKGEPLVSINSQEIRQSLKAKKSGLMNLITQVLPDLKFDYPGAYERMKPFLANLSMDKKLPQLPQPGSDREKYFLANRNIYQTYYEIAAIETKLEKYRLYAPFNGVVSNSTIKPGTLVRAGQQLGQFMEIVTFDMETEIPLEKSPLVKIGNKVVLTSDSIPGEWTGQVSRIAHTIDNKTRSIKVFVSLKSDQLKEGMFLTGTIASNTVYYGSEIPRKLLIEDNQVMVIKDSKIHLAAIDVLQFNENIAIVNGLPNGTLIPQKNSNLTKGMTVRVQ
jgi:multidrug efflux pump subunit AcrA (membrane-fusion protein)